MVFLTARRESPANKISLLSSLYHRQPATTHYSLLTTHYSLLTTHYPLLTTHLQLATCNLQLATTLESFIHVSSHALAAAGRLYFG